MVQDENLQGQIIDLGNNLLNEDPLFITDRYSLQNSSPCVNAGSPNLEDLDLPEFDLAGNPRIYGGRIDIGAYENQNQLVGIFNDKSENDIYKTNLVENYPNPFNTFTKIKFSVLIPSKVELTIYNIKGQLIVTIINEKMDSGLHTVIWDGKDNYGYPVPSGIYFYKIQINNYYNRIKRMILIK